MPYKHLAQSSIISLDLILSKDILLRGIKTKQPISSKIVLFLKKEFPTYLNAKQALSAISNGKRPVGWPRLRWLNHMEDLGWNRLGLSFSEMKEVVEDRDVWRLNLELLPPRPSRKSGNWKMNEWMIVGDQSVL